jgi:hypothetical protein
MAIYVFTSTNLTNIWAGIGAGLWAVSKSEHAPTNSGRKTKAQNMKIGSFGILYCSKNHSLTTPFVVLSNPNPERIIEDVWDGTWVLPFRIHPLGTPNKLLPWDDAKSVLPSPRSLNTTNLNTIVNVQATTVFSPSKLTEADWEVLVTHLAEGAAPTVRIIDDL